MVSNRNRPHSAIGVEPTWVYHYSCGNFNVHTLTIAFSAIFIVGLVSIIGFNGAELILGDIVPPTQDLYMFGNAWIRIGVAFFALICITSLLIGSILKKPGLYYPAIIILRLLTVGLVVYLVISYIGLFIKLHDNIKHIKDHFGKKNAEILAFRTMIKFLELFGLLVFCISMFKFLNIAAMDFMCVKKQYFSAEHRPAALQNQINYETDSIDRPKNYNSRAEV